MTYNMRTNLPIVEGYMHSCMNTSAHDMEHVYRVLNYALEIARHESELVDIELLTVVCLLHDIARMEQCSDENVDHALYGAGKAYTWLVKNGYSDEFASMAKECIMTHRFRSNNPPQSIEARILFDADKLDVCGAIGIARVLLSKSYKAEPIYSLTENGEVSDGAQDTQSSFLHEYKFKLEKLYGKFFTKLGIQLAEKRRTIAENFYIALLSEARECYSYSDQFKK